MKKYTMIDISLPLHRGTVVYPGNPRVRIAPLRSKTSYLSEITLGSHTGTHVDAPRHAFKTGRGVDRLRLEAFVGPCRVLALTSVTLFIGADDLRAQHIRRGERILAKTRNSRHGFRKFSANYVWLAPDAAEFLARKKIFLFGIDSLSVKQRGSPDNRPHTALLGRRIPIVEGLDLSQVTPGRYFLICLPLRFVGLDGAPARAVLLRR